MATMGENVVCLFFTFLFNIFIKPFLYIAGYFLRLLDEELFGVLKGQISRMCI